jgi:DNA replication protein DnaD
MSNHALNHVWKHSKQSGSALLVLVAIADAANDDGECYPGVSKLADKVNMKERNLQRIIRHLEASGELEVDYFQGRETQRGPTNRYRIVFDEGVQESAPVGVQSEDLHEEGVQGNAPVGVQGSAPKPSVEPSVNTKTEDDDDAGAREGENIFTLYHTTFGQLVSNPILADDLKDMQAEYPPQDIADAFRAAALANARSIKYVRSCLENWRINGRDKPKPADRPATPKGTGPLPRSNAPKPNPRVSPLPPVIQSAPPAWLNAPAKGGAS